MKSIGIFLFLLLLLVGCGKNDNNQFGTLVDDVVSGVKYVNAENSGFTDKNGNFPYESGLVEFYLGNIKIGEIDSLPSDKKIFIQDLVGVDRLNTDDVKVIKIAGLLQSLDSDKNSDEIEILEEDFNKFTGDIINIDDILDIETLLNEQGFQKVSDEDVKRHLDNVLKTYGIKTEDTIEESETLNISNIEINIDTNSELIIKFNNDIKKTSFDDDIITLKDENDEEVKFDIVHNFDKLTITTKEKIATFDGYTLNIEVSKLLSYGINENNNNDTSITFGEDNDAISSFDITPPTLKTDIDINTQVVSHSSLLEVVGSVSDNVSLKNLTLEINNESIDIEIDSENKFVANIPLKAGLNNYKLTAIDSSLNTNSISSSIYLGNTVAAGGSHSGAIKNNELYAWGRNNYAQTGLGYTSKLKDESNGTHPISPVKITTANEFVAISFNQNFSLAIDINGDVYSWGYNKNGELGRGVTGEFCASDEISDCGKSIVKVEGLSNIVSISAGTSHTLALKDDGSVWGFGTNNDGELGIGNTNEVSSPVKVIFPEDVNIIQVSAGSDFSMAIDDNGNLWAWGKNNNGQMALGEENTQDQLTPIKIAIPNNLKVKSLATGKAHVLVLTENGAVYGWGLNFSSQIGYNGYQFKGSDEAWDGYIYSPKLVIDSDNTNKVLKVFANGNSSYILREDKKVYPWGQYGETLASGKQSYNNLDFPEDKLTAITSVKNVSAGSLHLVAIQEDDTVFTWRWSYEGSLGGGESTVDIWFYNYPIKPIF